MLFLVLSLVDVASSTLNSLSWCAMPSSLISLPVLCAAALVKAKPLNFPVLWFIGKSILHASRKWAVNFKPKSSQISCFVISSSRLPHIYFSLLGYLVMRLSGMQYFVQLWRTGLCDRWILLFLCYENFRKDC